MCLYNWTQYTNPGEAFTPGQLLPYPLNIYPDGKIEPLDGFASFPGEIFFLEKLFLDSNILKVKIF